MGSESTLLPLFRALDTFASSVEDGEASGQNGIDWADVDFVTDRNNLRKLLRWVRENGASPIDPPSPAAADESSPTAETAVSPTSDKPPPSDTVSGGDPADAQKATEPEWDTRKDFRIDLQLGGANTVLMHRWAVNTQEYHPPPKAGCRINFERACTAAAPGCEDGTSHYRIVRYVSICTIMHRDFLT